MKWIKGSARRAKTQVYLMFFQRGAAYLKAAKQIKGSARRTEIQISTNDKEEKNVLTFFRKKESDTKKVAVIATATPMRKHAFRMKKKKFHRKGKKNYIKSENILQTKNLFIPLSGICFSK